MRRIFEIIFTSRGGDHSTQIRCLLWSSTSNLLCHKLRKIARVSSFIPLPKFIFVNGGKYSKRWCAVFHPPFCATRLHVRGSVMKCTNNWRLFSCSICVTEYTSVVTCTRHHNVVHVRAAFLAIMQTVALTQANRHQNIQNFVAKSLSNCTRSKKCISLSQKRQLFMHVLYYAWRL